VIDVTASETILAPREQVARYVMDHRNDAEWIGGISESELLGNEPFGVGSEVVQGEPSAIHAIAGPLLSRQVRRSVSRDLRTLRRLLQR
jgi:phage FluMu protein gp41